MSPRSALSNRSSSPVRRASFATFLRVFPVLCAAALSAACSSEGDDDGTPTPPGGDPTIIVTDANQYTSDATLTIPTIETAAVDVEFDWTAVTVDLQCNPVNPQADIRNISFLRFQGKTEEDIEEELTSSRLESSKVDRYWDHAVSAGDPTKVKLSEFAQIGDDKIDVDQDFTIDSTRTYLVLVQTSTTFGVGTKSMAFVKPVADGGNSVAIAPGCPGVLDFTAHLDKPKVAAPAAGPWIADWDSLTKDGTGGEISLAGVDKLLVGFYPNMTPADIEDEFFDLETLANPMYELGLGTNRKADLKGAKKRMAGGGLGENFNGFTQSGTGTWLLALTCSSCPNPQPVALAILEPSGG
jgi:hypothetical protein